MPKVFLVIDHWFPAAKALLPIHRYFFLTNTYAIRDAPQGDYEYIVDNGTYYYKRPRIELILRAIRKGFYFILPDYLADPQRTLQAHLRFFQYYEEECKKLGFLVLQGRTAQEMLELLDQYQEHGLTVIRRVAIGGPKERNGRRAIVKQLYLELKKRGFYVHALGIATRHADSFDTMTPFSWWYRKKWNEENLRRFIRYFIRWRGRYDAKSLIEYLK